MVGAVEVNTGAALGDACEVLHILHERCVRRETLREGDSPEDLEWTRTSNGMLVLPVREGFLMKYWDSGLWALAISYKHDYGSRVIVRASLVDLERYARDIQRYGPTGGPTYVAGPLRWVRFDDATWHAAAIDGEMRLMPLGQDGEHLLLHTRNDRSGSVAVLGIGGVEELKDAAEQGGDEAATHYLRIWIDGRPHLLRCVGAERIVAVLEHGDERFALCHLGGELFGLVGYVRDEVRHFRIYTLKELQRGDLGPVVALAQHTEPVAPPAPTRASAEASRADPAERSQGRGPSPKLRGLELQHVLAHLTPRVPPTGPASSMVPFVLASLRTLVQRECVGRLLWASELQALLMRRGGLHPHCCLKTLNLALHAVAALTPLLVRRGRRWLLRLEELLDPSSGLLASIVRATPLLQDDVDVELAPVDVETAPHSSPRARPGRDAPRSSAVEPTRDAGEPEAVQPDASGEAGAPEDVPGEQAENSGPPQDDAEPTREAVPTSRGLSPSGSTRASPLAAVSGLMPGIPEFFKSSKAFCDWLDENQRRLAQNQGSARAPPNPTATGGLRLGPRREGRPFRWTRRRP